MHPSQLTVNIIPHEVHVGCTQPYHHNHSQGAHWMHPCRITIITHKVHIGCTLSVSQCTCHTPRTCYAWAERVPCAHALCATCMSRMCHVRTQHMLRAPRTCYARVMHVPCTCHAPRTYQSCALCICHKNLPRAAHMQCMCTVCAVHILRATHTFHACALCTLCHAHTPRHTHDMRAICLIYLTPRTCSVCAIYLPRTYHAQLTCYSGMYTTDGRA